MPRPVIYYVRHGETDWNRTGRLQGTLDIPLDGLGRRQAAQAGRILLHLIAANGANKDSLAFVASPLGRARATMELMRSELNMPLADYLLDDRLREIGYGGKAVRSPKARLPIPRFSAPARQMDGIGAGRGNLRVGAAADARLV